MKHPVTVVIKVGSASLVDTETLRPRISIFQSIADLIANIRRNGHRAVLVSSGAVAIGRGIHRARKTLTQDPPKQALSAIGQSKLTMLWEEVFWPHNQAIAQVLLQNDQHATSSSDTQTAETLRALLDADVVPIVNENDAIATTSTSGNDVLALKIATMVEANVLAFLTDVDCLYTHNPRDHPDHARAIETVTDGDELGNIDVSTQGSGIGTGGMALKLFAARLASEMGITTVINHVARASNVAAIVHNISLEAERDWIGGEAYPSDESESQYEQGMRVCDRASKLSTSIHTIFLPSPPSSPRRTGSPYPPVYSGV